MGPGIMVARWYIFIPKIPILVFWAGLQMENVVKFHGHFEYFKAMW
jgi:hypothetical protein